MADSSDVDAAVIALLAGDATLMALMPGGVFFDVAPPGLTQFVIVSQMAHEDAYTFGASLWERFLYLVKAVMQGPSNHTANEAAARIHVLLQDVPLPVTGYSTRLLQRTDRIRVTEVDDDLQTYWQHRGGLYELFAAPLPS
jgi:hypothetical protein